MKIKRGLIFADKSGERDYKIVMISKKKNIVYVHSIKYGVKFKIPIDILESYLEEIAKEEVIR